MSNIYISKEYCPSKFNLGRKLTEAKNILLYLATFKLEKTDLKSDKLWKILDVYKLSPAQMKPVKFAKFLSYLLRVLTFVII